MLDYRVHVGAHALVAALINEDADEINNVLFSVRENDATEAVLCAVAGLFVDSLVNVHGEVGGLAKMDGWLAVRREVFGA